MSWARVAAARPAGASVANGAVATAQAVATVQAVATALVVHAAVYEHATARGAEGKASVSENGGWRVHALLSAQGCGQRGGKRPRPRPRPPPPRQPPRVAASTPSRSCWTLQGELAAEERRQWSLLTSSMPGQEKKEENRGAMTLCNCAPGLSSGPLVA